MTNKETFFLRLEIRVIDHTWRAHSIQRGLCDLYAHFRCLVHSWLRLPHPPHVSLGWLGFLYSLIRDHRVLVLPRLSTFQPAQSEHSCRSVQSTAF